MMNLGQDSSLARHLERSFSLVSWVLGSALFELVKTHGGAVGFSGLSCYEAEVSVSLIARSIESLADMSLRP
jgi:hypothetical protein